MSNDNLDKINYRKDDENDIKMALACSPSMEFVVSEKYSLKLLTSWRVTDFPSVRNERVYVLLPAFDSKIHECSQEESMNDNHSEEDNLSHRDML